MQDTQGQHDVCGYAHHRQPGVFEDRDRKEIRPILPRRLPLWRGKSAGNIFSAVVHMDERTPHLHLCFTPITWTGGYPLKRYWVIGRSSPNGGRVSRRHEEAVPRSQTGRECPPHQARAHPTWLFKQSINLVNQQRAISCCRSHDDERREEAGRNP